MSDPDDPNVFQIQTTAIEDNDELARQIQGLVCHMRELLEDDDQTAIQPRVITAAIEILSDALDELTLWMTAQNDAHRSAAIAHTPLLRSIINQNSGRISGFAWAPGA